MKLRPNILPLAIAASALLASASALADIVDAPPSIVNHGSYITDTTSHLDWYRFDNAANTVGLSFDAAVAQFAPLGWAAASEAQVQGLQSQFGWVADTPGGGSNANFGLTDAMSSYLGYTNTFYTFGIGLESTRYTDIEAMTWDAFFTVPEGLGPYQFTTFSEAILSTDAHGQTFYTGDRVVGEFAFPAHDVADDFVGTWLVRASVDNGGCTRAAAAPCDIPTITPVPEPETWVLTAMGLVGLLMRRHRRRD